MATITVRVKGLREAQHAFRKAEDGLLPMFREELKEAALPVADTARSLVSRYQGAKLATIRPHVQMTKVFVRQDARKVTGKRGDFGALQQRRFEEALDRHSGAIPARIEQAVGRFIDSAGL